MNPRIPSASLSESLAVNETVLPAASQNITAYAVNTEQSQGYRQVLTDMHPLCVKAFQTCHFSVCLIFVIILIYQDRAEGSHRDNSSRGDS